MQLRFHVKPFGLALTHMLHLFTHVNKIIMDKQHDLRKYRFKKWRAARASFPLDNFPFNLPLKYQLKTQVRDKQTQP